MNFLKQEDFKNIYFIVIYGMLYFLKVTFVYGTDNFALMSGSLRTFQAHACDGEILRINCLPHTVISINYAQYGRPSAIERCQHAGRGAFSNRRRRNQRDETTCISQVALRVIENKCQEQVSCRLMTSPQTFLADPCPDEIKFAEVAYKCRPVEFTNVIACEGEKMNLSCEEPLRILVYSATFGSAKNPVMECPQQDSTTSEECYSSYATESVVNMCVGKRTCSFDVDSHSLGNPKCSEWIRKHLKVVYTCVPPAVLKLKGSKSDGSISDLSQTTKEIEVHTTSYPAWASNIDQRIPSYLLPAVPTFRPATTDLKLEMQRDYISTTETNTSDIGDRELVSFISEWIAAEHYITGNKSKLAVYVSVSLAVGVLLFVAVVLMHVFVLRKLDKQSTENLKKEPVTITADDFFNDSDIEHFEDDPLNMMNSLPRKISETVPRAPVSNDPSTNHYFS